MLLQPAREELERIEVELSLDGTVKQKFALRDCVFTVEQIIARWSILGIKPGDWLAIGASMAMAGDRLQNPVPLKIGSTIRCSSTAIGELSHQVVVAAEACVDEASHFHPSRSRNASAPLITLTVSSICIVRMGLPTTNRINPIGDRLA